MTNGFRKSPPAASVWWAVLFVLLVSRADAQDLLISELVAWNQAGLEDEDGEAHDWIEIFNAGEEPVNLLGYKLTDDVENLAKWEFPDLEIRSGQFLVVFASGKDRRDPAGNLHTNFQLERDGELLILLSPDGQNVLSGYNPYPEQLAGVSYGLATDSTFFTVLGQGSPVRVHVPGDDGLGRDWIGPDFDDSGWRAGTFGVGLEGSRQETYTPLIGTDVEADMDDINATCYVRTTFDVEDPSVIDVMTLRMKYDDGFVAYVNGVRVASANGLPDDQLSWNSTADGSNRDTSAVVFEDFDITQHSGALRAGANVLAIHGLNLSMSSNDFLILAEMKLVDVGEVQRTTSLYFVEPTPGGPNGEGFPEVAPRPGFSHDSGAFSAAQEISLTTDLEGATIRYTTNGDVPGETSTAYTAPIALNGSMKLTARTFHPERLPSTPESRVYATLAANAQDFSSNIPLLIVNTLGRQIGSNCDGPYTPGFLMVLEPEEGGRVRITDEASFADRAGFRRRGSSTCGRQKFSFNIEIQDDEGDDRNVSLLGFPPESDWVMYGPYNFDRALMRNPIAYFMSREVGEWAPRTRFVECFYHRANGPISMSSYFGVYVFMEKVKRAADRVDVARLDDADRALPEVSGGYIMKIDRQGAGEISVNAGGFNLVMNYPKRPNSQQRSYLTNFVNQMRASLSPTTIIERDGEFVDVQSWIDHHILMTFPKNVDAFRLSGYMHKDRDGPMEMGPCWDYDRSMGSTDGRDVNPLAWANTGGDGGTSYFAFGWYGPLFRNRPPYGNDPWAAAYRDRWRVLRQGPLSTENIIGRLDSWAEELEEAAARNFSRWPGSRPRSVFGGGFMGEVRHLQDWLRRRVEWIDGEFVETPSINPPGGNHEPGVEVVLGLDAPSEGIYYTLDDSDPRGGNRPSPAAILYEAPFTIDTNTRVKVRAHYGGALWSGLAQETYITRVPAVTISELHYHPLDPTPEEDPDDQYSTSNMEFIELKNVGTEPVDLTAMRFSRGLLFDFADDSSILALQPGEVVVLVNDLDAFRARYGENSRVAGEFGGSLSDRSERLTMEGALDIEIVSIMYRDAWHTETDGGGPSLENVDPYGPADGLEDAARWRASEVIHGTPGVDPFDEPGGLRRKGDINDDGELNVTDAVLILGFLFGGGQGSLPCGDGTLESAGNVALLNVDGAGGVDVTDAIHILSFLFQGGPAGEIGSDCVRISGCDDGCAQ